LAKHFRFTGKAITLFEPWASAIAFAGKDVENRTWRTHYRGPLAIHAGAESKAEDLDRLVRGLSGKSKRPLRHWIRQGQRRAGILGEQEEMLPSHILAIAMLTNCVERSSSPWYQRDSYGFLVTGVVPIEPIPMTGALGLWDCRFKYRPFV